MKTKKKRVGGRQQPCLDVRRELTVALQKLKGVQQQLDRLEQVLIDNGIIPESRP